MNKSLDGYITRVDKDTAKALHYIGDPNFQEESMYEDDDMEIDDITLEQGEAYADDAPAQLQTNDYGDPYDDDYDDDDDFGDLDDDDFIDQDDDYGDIDLDEGFGDIELGAPRRRLPKSARRALAKAKKRGRVAKMLPRKLMKGLKKTSAKKKLSSLRKTEIAAGKVPQTTRVRFLDVKGGTIKSAAIQSDASFEIGDRMQNVALAMNEVPYPTYIETQTGGTTITFNVDATALYAGGTAAKVPYFVVKLGGPLLTSVTNSAFNFVISFYNPYGTSTSLGTTSIIATGNNAFNITLVVTPWVLIRSIPRVSMCALDATAAHFSVVIPGVTTDTKATLIIPGRDDKTINDVLNSLRK